MTTSTGSGFSPDKLDHANAIARANCPEILFCLASASRDTERLPDFLVKLRLSEARTATERLLVAILAAEQSTALRPTPAPANDHPTYADVLHRVADVMREEA